MAAAAHTFVAQGSSPALPSLQAQDFSAAPGTRETLDRYCVTCHNERLKTGGLALDRMDLARVPEGADVWEKVVRKLRTGAMPPAGARRPDPAAADALASWLETTLDRAAAADPESRARRCSAA